MFNMLVAFYKDDDVQYHVFADCPNRTEFIHDDLFKSFVNNGYTWSAVSFPIDLAYNCGFTISFFNDVFA